MLVLARSVAILLPRLSTNRTRKTQLAATAVAEMVAVAQLDSWNPKRFLTISETMHGVAIGYDWFYNEMSPHERSIIEDGLVRNGLAVGNECWEANCTWVPGIAGVGKCTNCWWTR